MTDIHQNEIAFLGKITAGATHEMKNVLAIIKETSGLIEDLFALTPQTSVHQEKIQKALTTIGTQVRRGVALSTRLNQFAHGTDTPVRPISPIEAVHLIVELAGRFARLKDVALTVRPPSPGDPGDRLTTRPIRLQMALLAAIECWLERSSPGRQISVYPIREERSVRLVVEYDGDPPPPSAPAGRQWEVLESIVADLGGQLETADRPSRILIRLQDLAPVDGAENG